MSNFGTIVADRFELRGVLGRGGMGCVWLAHDRTLRRHVALKETTPTGTETLDLKTLRDLAVREARSTAQINHPNVIRILDIVDAAGRPWIVMEHVPSCSLRELITRDGPLPPADVAAVGAAVLDGLIAAHRAGVLHRDVKPGNILIGHDGRVVLVDFGIARWYGHPADDAPSLGTPRYVPPERVAADLSLPEGDLYSLGATLYTAVEGHGPYDGNAFDDTLSAVLESPPDPPRCAGELAAVLDGLMRRDPFQRWRPERARPALLRIARGARCGAIAPGRVVPVSMPTTRPAPPMTAAMPVVVPTH